MDCWYQGKRPTALHCQSQLCTLLNSIFFVSHLKCHDELCTSTKNPLYDAGKSSTSQNLHQIVNIDYGDGKLVDADYYKVREYTFNFMTNII